MDKKVAILEAAKELFLLKGFKAINVSDITKKAGVSVGTFYNYYESKEKLFLEVFIEENRHAKKLIIDKLNMNESPEKITKEYMTQSFEFNRNNLILKEWYGNTIADELHKYFDVNGKDDVKFIRHLFSDLLEKWKQEKNIRQDIPNETLLSIFDMLVYLDQHQEDIGTSNFPEAIQVLGEFIIKGFTTIEKN